MIYNYYVILLLTRFCNVKVFRALSSNVLFKIPWLSKILNPLHIFEVIIENICKLLVPLLSENPNAPEDKIYGGRTPLPFKIDFALLDF